MLKKILFLMSFCLSTFSALGIEPPKIDRMQWGDLDIVYLPDDRFPLYSIMIYFADGSLSDGKDKGVTAAAFELLKSGTSRFNQKEISDNLEFYGVSYGASVTHEYSTYSVSGLVDDFAPTLKKICHLFSAANYPPRELRKYKKRMRNSLLNMVNDPSSLASRAFRQLSLDDSPFFYPTSGKLRDVKRIRRKELLAKLNYFNKNVKKRIYITGPKKILESRRIFTDECGWKGQGEFVREVDWLKKKQKKRDIYLVTVPKANQVQLRWGRSLHSDELGEPVRMKLASSYLGGGFTSLLMREVRVKRGLSYGARSYAAPQRYYGRSVISTFTKQETTKELIDVIDQTIDQAVGDKYPAQAFERSRNYLIGSYPFKFERSDALLSEILSLDHQGKDYSELFEFQNKVESLRKGTVLQNIKDLYKDGGETIVIVGPKSVAKQLKKLEGNLKIVNYKKFL